MINDKEQQGMHSISRVLPLGAALRDPKPWVDVEANQEVKV